MDTVGAALNASGGGKIVLMTAGSVSLVTVNLETVIAAASGGILSVILTAKLGTAVAAGTAALAKLTNGAAVDQATGLTVGTAASDVILNDVVLIIGSQVTLNSGTITSG